MKITHDYSMIIKIGRFSPLAEELLTKSLAQKSEYKVLQVEPIGDDILLEIIKKDDYYKETVVYQRKGERPVITSLDQSK